MADTTNTTPVSTINPLGDALLYIVGGVLWVILGVLLLWAPPVHAQTYSDCAINLRRIPHRGAGDSFWAPVTIRGVSDMRLTVEAMVDTGFSGELQLPRVIVDQLRANNMIDMSPMANLLRSHGGDKVTSRLANGTIVEEDVTYVTAQLADCGYNSAIQVVVVGDRGVPLIGQGLLSDYFGTSIDYTNDQIHVLKQPQPSHDYVPAPIAPGAVPFFIRSSKPRR